MYKTILVHVDESKQSAARVDTAARLALANEAHLIGSAMTGLSAFQFPITIMDAGVPPIVFPIEELRAAADQALDQFEAGMSAFGVHSSERRRLDDDAGVGLCLQARYADLVIISQTPGGQIMANSQSDLPQYVVLHCARPVLVLPAAGMAGPIGQRVTVAWNGSAEAARAIASALPLLKSALHVSLLVLEEEGDTQTHGEQPGADMAVYLARHGVQVEVNVIQGSGDDGGALLSFAADQRSDLIVMGAYGHSRLREFVLGGVTRTTLRRSPIALWMAH